MVSVEVLARFKESQLFPDTETGLAPGYVPARIVTPSEGERMGFTIDLERLKKGQRVTTIVFERQFTIGEDPFDVSEALGSDSAGSEWLETIEGRYGDIKPEILLEEIPFTPLIYTIYDDDVFQNNLLSCALLKRLPDGARYVRLHPLMKDRNGEALSPKQFHPRKVTDAHGHTTDYTTQEAEEVASNAFFALNSHGVLLGKIDFHDLTPVGHFDWRERDFRQEDFPMQHFVETVYPVPLRHAHRISSLSVEIHLAP